MSLLERFDTPVPIETGPSADWLAGHAAGLAEAALAARFADAERHDRALQSLADLSFTFREAENLVLDRLAPLLQLIARRIIPESLTAAMPVHLCTALIDAAVTDARSEPMVHLSPADLEQARPVLAAAGGFAAFADPALRPGQALIRTSTGETSFDFRSYGETLARAVEALGQNKHLERRTENG